MIGCAGNGEDGTVAPQYDAGGVDTGTGTGPSPTDATVAECTTVDEGSARACTCTGGAAGRQICFGGKYTGCECATIPDGGGTPGGGGALCSAGYYTGDFDGKYKPGAFGFGIFMGFLEFEILGAAVGGVPALSFTLEKSSTGTGGEFETYTVKNGCMLGSAKAAGTDNPFVARLTGNLDCQTGIFDGTITGNYDFIQSGVKFQFTGPLSAQYQNPQKRLKDGIWNVKEPPALDGTAAGGGGGMWDAIWEAESAPPGADPCAALVLPDAGTTVGASDAGVDGSI